MNLSLNEVEALAKKATRGAGYPWGLAEEAAKATRWLCAHDVDGCAELAGLLEQCDGTDLSDWSPQIDGATWRARGERLCPITTGAALSDHADALRTDELRIKNVARPLLLAPFVGMSADYLETTISLIWNGATVSTDGNRLGITGSTKDAAELVTVKTGGDIPQPTTRRTRADQPKGYETLSRMAKRTYAPATEQSRLTGAGAGLSDND